MNVSENIAQPHSLRGDGDEEEEEDVEPRTVRQSAQFQIYTNKYPLLRPFDQEYFNWKGYDQMTETKEFNYDQFQEVMASEFSDYSWAISHSNKLQFAEQLKDSVNASTPSRFQVVFDYKFERELPLENKTTKGNQTKHLQLHEYYDCLTSLDIRKTLKLVENELNETTGKRPCDETAADGSPKWSTIRFYEAFFPIVVLGPS